MASLRIASNMRLLSTTNPLADADIYLKFFLKTQSAVPDEQPDFEVPLSK